MRGPESASAIDHPALLKRLYRFRENQNRRGLSRLLMRQRKAALTAAFARDWRGGYVLTDSGDLAFVPAPLDARGIRLLFYGFASPTAARAFVPEGGTVIDVGANLGEWSVPLARAVGPSGRLLGIEPNPGVAEALAASLRINNLPQAEVLLLALSDTDGSGRLHTDPRDSGLSRLVVDGDDAEKVVMRRLDTVVSEHGLSRLDFLKIDVEGHERQVLTGAADTLRRFQPTLVFESGHEPSEARGQIARLLEGLGYDLVAVLHDYGALPCNWDHYAAAEGACVGSEARNLLALPLLRAGRGGDSA